MIKAPLLPKQLWVIVEKNIKRLLSSKISASIILFGPLVMIFLIGAAFQSSGFFGVKVGVYSENYNEISQEIVDSMHSSDFIILEETTLEECIENVKQTKTHLCITFPSDFSSGKLRFYVDYSRLNLVYAIVSKISSEITTLSDQISLGTAEDILEFIGNSTDQLEASGRTLSTLQSNAEGLQNQMAEIALTLQGLDLNQRAGALTSITSESGNVSLNIDYIIGKVDELDVQLEDADDTLDDMDSQLTQSLNNIDIAYAARSCSPQNSRDLSPFLLGNNFTEELLLEQNPTCSVLVTFRTSLATYNNNLQDSKEIIDTMRSTANDLKSNIVVAKENLKSDANLAIQDLEQIDDAKQNLSAQLYAMSRATGYGVQAFNLMNIQLSALTGQFRDLSLTDANSVIKPIKTSIKPLTTKKINTLDIIFPAIVVMIIMFVGILIGTILVMREKTSSAYFRNLIMPVRDYVFILGTYITTIIVTFAQLTIIIGIAVLFFNTQLEFNIASMAVIFIFSTVVFASIGMIIGYLTNSEETSIMASISLTIILLLFSNIIIPIETMEESIGIIARFTPFNVTELILRRTLILGSGLASLDFLMMAVFLIQFVVLVAGVSLASRHEAKRKK